MQSLMLMNMLNNRGNSGGGLFGGGGGRGMMRNPMHMLGITGALGKYIFYN